MWRKIFWALVYIVGGLALAWVGASILNVWGRNMDLCPIYEWNIFLMLIEGRL